MRRYDAFMDVEIRIGGAYQATVPAAPCPAPRPRLSSVGTDRDHVVYATNRLPRYLIYHFRIILLMIVSRLVDDKYTISAPPPRDCCCCVKTEDREAVALPLIIMSTVRLLTSC